MLSVRLRVVMYFHAPFAFVLYLCRYCKFYENENSVYIISKKNHKINNNYIHIHLNSQNEFKF